MLEEVLVIDSHEEASEILAQMLSVEAVVGADFDVEVRYSMLEMGEKVV